MRSECKIQRELDHPNIVKMIDAFETDNEVNIGGDTKSFFIDLQVISVAEFVPGELFRLFDQYRQEVGGARRSSSSPSSSSPSNLMLVLPPTAPGDGLTQLSAPG